MKHLYPEKIPTKENSALPGAALKSKSSQTQYTAAQKTSQQKSTWTKADAHGLMTDPARRTKAPRGWAAPEHAKPKRDLVFERNYQRVFHELPERAGYEAIQEIISTPEKTAEILQRYAGIPDGLLNALGVDRLPAPPLLGVPT